MTVKRAARRYYLVFAPAMAIFLAASFSIDWIDDNLIIQPAALYGLTIVPIMALISTFWAHWRFLTEVDEFLREIQLKALLIGLVCVMVIATTWGYLEAYANAPDLKLFWINPIFWVSYAIAGGIISLREGAVL